MWNAGYCAQHEYKPTASILFTKQFSHLLQMLFVCAMLDAALWPSEACDLSKSYFLEIPHCKSDRTNKEGTLEYARII